MADANKLDRKREPDADEEQQEGGKSRLRWIIGWVVVPSSLLGALFLAGVHVGANHPEMWLSRLIAWIGS